MLFCGANAGREKEKTAGRPVSIGFVPGPDMRSSEDGVDVECFDLYEGWELTEGRRGSPGVVAVALPLVLGRYGSTVAILPATATLVSSRTLFGSSSVRAGKGGEQLHGRDVATRYRMRGGRESVYSGRCAKRRLGWVGSVPVGVHCRSKVDVLGTDKADSRSLR